MQLAKLAGKGVGDGANTSGSKAIKFSIPDFLSNCYYTQNVRSFIDVLLS
jgi:hypothetical protein